MSAKVAEKMRPAKVDLVSIALCCNDPDNGMFAGEIYKVEIGDDVLSLDSKYFPDSGARLKYKFKADKDYSVGGFGTSPVTGGIRISRRWFPVWGYKASWGNWCWDLVLMTAETTIDLVNYLKELNSFQVESGETRWFNYFQADGAVFEKDPNTWIRTLGKWGYQKP